MVSYLKKYHLDTLKQIKWWHGISLLALIMMTATAVWYFGYSIKFIRYNAIYLFSELNKLPAIVCALLLFFGFQNLHIESKQISRFSSHVFAAYLITDHPQIREYIFRPVVAKFDSNLYPLIYISWACLLIVICVAVDVIRSKMDKLLFQNKR